MISNGVLLLVCFVSISSALQTLTPHYNRQQALHFKKISHQNAAPAFNPFSKSGFNVDVKPQPSSLSQIYSDLSNGDLIGEDAATFNLSEQSLKDWGTFLVAVGGILSFLFYAYWDYYFFL